ncbi:MAG: PDZ domain-containing protein [Candidatus Eisenbacteria bacterium]
MEIDPAAEWRQMFAETWRIARDFFYDPGMHGVDWPAVRAKYEPLLAAVAVRDDLTFLQKQMVAELNCGHAYIVGGDQERAPRIPMGYLGVDLEPVAGASVPAYRITRILPGDGFDLDSRSPLLTPGIDASVGDFILAVNGRPVSLEQDFQALLVGLAGQEITLTINDQPSREGAHDVLVQPMSGERRARYYDWVESRRQYVTEHGGDDLGYLHIPDMGNRGFEEFAKHYYSNLGRDGMIYDVRFNGGGYINAMLLLQMSSPQYSFFKPRYGVSWSRQDWAFPGYSTALCNDQSGSNAEEFSDAFQRLKLGPLIGTRTWGGEVGSGGGYRLVDGGRVFIPNYGAWTPDGTWIIEGRGVDPDMVVEDDPTALMNGRDPQLDAAIAYLKKKIAEKPIVRPTPPPVPNKSTGGSDQELHRSIRGAFPAGVSGVGRRVGPGALRDGGRRIRNAKTASRCAVSPRLPRLVGAERGRNPPREGSAEAAANDAIRGRHAVCPLSGVGGRDDQGVLPRLRDRCVRLRGRRVRGAARGSAFLRAVPSLLCALRRVPGGRAGTVGGVRWGSALLVQS